MEPTNVIFYWWFSDSPRTRLFTSHVHSCSWVNCVNEEENGAQRLPQNNYMLYCWSWVLNSSAETFGTVKGNCGRRIYVRHGTNVKPLQRRMSGKQIAITVSLQRRLQVLIHRCPLTDLMGIRRRKNSIHCPLRWLLHFSRLCLFHQRQNLRSPTNHRSKTKKNKFSGCCSANKTSGFSFLL